MDQRRQGASWNGRTTRFAIQSGNADRIDLCLFDDGVETRLAMEGEDGFFSAEVEVGPGHIYGFRAYGSACHPQKLLLDPFARNVVGELTWGESVFAGNELDSADAVPKGMVIDDAFEWEGVTAPLIPWEDTVIYETHVKGLSEAHPELDPDLQGTFLGAVTPPILDHLQQLGITTVELLPVFFFIDDLHLGERGLRNYWGYQPVNWLAPANRYAANDPVREFKTLVREFHRAGIEVIIDVVYNHSGEGADDGPVINLGELGGYYLLKDGKRIDWSGTGNTLDFAGEPARRLLTDSLRYWVEEMRVDGFRFDLAVTLGRQRASFHTEFLEELGQDPALASTKLVAEPWDLGPAGYRLGGFPPGWREWNGSYRDTIRDFWRGSRGTVDEFASRVAGSSDLFGQRGPSASVSLITSHDGYTLADLVAYEERHNEANGEDNRDGHRDNRSWNGGVEGPTEDPQINLTRRRRQRSLLTTLFLSRGVPMLLGGDELGRTQHGNNNAYSQDNETSWYDWDHADTELLEFVLRLIALRRRYRVLQQGNWLSGEPPSGSGVEDAFWFAPTGKDMHPLDWKADFARTLGLYLNGAVCQPASESLAVLFNAFDQPVAFTIPDVGVGSWTVELDSAATQPSGTTLIGKVQLVVESFSVMVLASN